MSDLVQKSPDEFITFLREKGIRRFYFIYDREIQRVLSSHEELLPLCSFFEDDQRDYRQHEGIFFQVGEKYDVLHGAFVHQTRRGQGQGGTRFWSYDSLEDYFRDGLRLSKGMTRKNALAGLWWGGGKGVISRSEKFTEQQLKDPEFRKEIFQEYGAFVTSLNGCYITAEDVGTNTTDIDHIFSSTRFVTCIPEQKGGSGNPSSATALGVVRGMQAALHFLDGSTLEGKKVAVQGMGNVGEPLIQYLFEEKVGEVVACDINEESVLSLKERFKDYNLKASVVGREDQSLLFEPCDVLAPCATGAAINPRTIPEIQARIVCGAANNQLEDPARDDALLHERGILYVPDFLVNRMGIVQCANEQYGYVGNDRFIQRHFSRDWEHSVYQTTLQVLEESQKSGEPAGIVAVRLADELALQEHPIFGHRGQEIIDSFAHEEWIEE